MKAFPRLRPRLNVGLKVAGMVVLFELLMIVAYTIATNLILDEASLLRFLNLEKQNLVAVVLISSLVLAGYLTYMVIVRIFSPVSILMHGTDQIMQGNLDLKLDIRTGDELEFLAQRFNAMAVALKAERDSLELKVEERTRDLAEARRKDLERQNELLKLKDEFLFVAAHELRTPVTSIRWSLESVADRKMSDPVKTAFQDAMTASRGLALLVEDLLNMARLDAKRIPFKKEPVNLKEAAHAVLKDLVPLGAKRKVALAVEAPDDQPVLALADERRVVEVLMNLVGNAVKYNKEGGAVVVRIGKENGTVRMDVVDDGPGIPVEEQKHLFEKFWRSDSTAQIEGSGLGLFIVKRLVEGMNGTVGFSSAPDKGTTFTVRLPLSQA